MTRALAIASRRRRHETQGIGMPGDNSRIVELAKRLKDQVDAAVLGGIAVYLHGGGRSTADLDFYTPDRPTTARQLEAAGARWDARNREHVLDGVAIHTVTPEETRYEVERTSILDGVRVVSLKDLVAIKLLSGLNNPARGRDIGDVEDLIRNVPLDKRLAGKLPRELRATFKKLVDAVRAAELARRGRPRL